MQIIRCERCHHTFFKRSAWKFADLTGVNLFDNHDADDTSRQRLPTVNPFELPGQVRVLYAETLRGFNATAMSLATGGIRSVVEAICLEQGRNDHTPQGKIRSLATKEIISRRDADRLRKLRFLAADGVLAIHAPSKDEFEIFLQLVEHLLTSIYVLPHLDQKLRRLQPTPSPKVH